MGFSGDRHGPDSRNPHALNKQLRAQGIGGAGEVFLGLCDAQLNLSCYLKD